MNQEQSPELTRLIDAARAGKDEACDALIRLYQKRVAAFLFAMCGRAEPVEDLAQAVFLKMTLSLSRLREPQRFESWLFRLARNVYLDHYRRERLRRFFVPFAPEHEEMPDPAPRPGDSHSEALWRALRALPAAQRELIVLLMEKDWSYEELAAMTGATVSSVKSKLFRARSELRALMSHES